MIIVSPSNARFRVRHKYFGTLVTGLRMISYPHKIIVIAGGECSGAFLFCHYRFVGFVGG